MKILNFLIFHFLIQMMWSKKWYYYYYISKKNYEIHPIDFIIEITKEVERKRSN